MTIDKNYALKFFKNATVGAVLVLGLTSQDAVASEGVEDGSQEVKTRLVQEKRPLTFEQGEAAFNDVKKSVTYHDPKIFGKRQRKAQREGTDFEALRKKDGITALNQIVILGTFLNETNARNAEQQKHIDNLEQQLRQKNDSGDAIVMLNTLNDSVLNGSSQNLQDPTEYDYLLSKRNEGDELSKGATCTKGRVFSYVVTSVGSAALGALGMWLYFYLSR